MDFKVVLASAKPSSNNQLRTQLGDLRERVTAAFQAEGFPFEPVAKVNPRSRDSNHYITWQLPYDSDGAGEGLRPTIKVELNYSPLRAPALALPVSFLCGRGARATARAAGDPLRRPGADGGPRSWCR